MTSDDPQTGLDAFLCFDVYAANQAFGRVYKPLLDPLGLTYAQYLAMVVLWSDAPLSVGALGQRLGLESSTLTPLLKRLEAGGRVTRQRDPQDERRVIVTLTEAGRALEAEARDIPRCVGAATGLSERKLAKLQTRLRQLSAALNATARGTDGA